MNRDFESLYYEQQASYTESNGMLTQENERLRARVEQLEKERDECVLWCIDTALATNQRGEVPGQNPNNDGHSSRKRGESINGICPTHSEPHGVGALAARVKELRARHALGCFNDMPGAVLCQVCGGDIDNSEAQR